jgi:hypothetical protein
MSFARVRALVVIGVLSVAAVVFVIVALVRDSQGDTIVGDGCPDGFVRANVTLQEPKEVKIKVYNGTENAGWAADVTANFKNRGFQVVKPDEGKSVNEIAILRYGPKTVSGAHLLRAYFLDEARLRYDAKRTDDVVDVIVGTRFQQLATTTEVNQSLAAIGEPVLPPGACPAPPPKKGDKAAAK